MHSLSLKSGTRIKYRIAIIITLIYALLYKNISFILYYRKGWCFWGVWEMGGDRDRLLYWPNSFSWPQNAMLSSRTQLAFLPHLGWGCLTGDRSGAFLVCKLVFTLAFLSITDSMAAGIFHNVHLLPLLLPFIYTCASVIDGSVKGQYITKCVTHHVKIWIKKNLQPLLHDKTRLFNKIQNDSTPFLDFYPHLWYFGRCILNSS